jgi:hypothetical protein
MNPRATFVSSKCGSFTHWLKERKECNTALPTHYNLFLLENTELEYFPLRNSLHWFPEGCTLSKYHSDIHL